MVGIRVSACVACNQLTNAAHACPLCAASSPHADVFMRHQPIIGLALAAAAAINTDAQDSAGLPPPAKVWEKLADLERQLLLTLPDGTQGRDMLVAMLLEAVQAAHPSQVGSSGTRVLW